LYADKPRVALEIHVQFEDGRAGTVRADLEIHEARTFAATAPTPTAQKRQAVA
jgi:hypothetical protein